MLRSTSQDVLFCTFQANSFELHIKFLTKLHRFRFCLVVSLKTLMAISTIWCSTHHQNRLWSNVCDMSWTCWMHFPSCKFKNFHVLFFSDVLTATNIPSPPHKISFECSFLGWLLNGYIFVSFSSRET